MDAVSRQTNSCSFHRRVCVEFEIRILGERNWVEMAGHVSFKY